MHCSDGNLYALKQYEKEQDQYDVEDIALETAQEDLENDLFDGYMLKNGYVVDWVDEQIADQPEELLRLLRENFTFDGQAIRTVYMKYIGKVCQRLAESMDSLEEIEKLYKDADLCSPEVTGVQ